MKNQNYYQKIEDTFLLRASGRDVNRYLQARLTNDLKKLEGDESSLLAAILDPQGKTEGVFTVAKDGKDFLLLADGGKPDEVLAGLLRFKVADQVDVVIEEEVAVFHLAYKDKNSLPTIEEAVLMPEPETQAKRTDLRGTYFILPNSKVEETIAQLDAFGTSLPPEHATALRIKNRRPLFPLEVLPGRIFSESGLMEAVSFTKGCYAGQEVIEKSIARGKPPKVLVQLDSTGNPPSPGDKVFADSGSVEAGNVLTVGTANGTNYYFALIKTKYEDSELSLS